MDELNSRAQRDLVYGSASGWKPVTGSILDNSVFELILLISFSNCTYAGVECILGKLADDMKWDGAVEFLEEEETLQRDWPVALGDYHAAWTAS